MGASGKMILCMICIPLLLLAIIVPILTMAPWWQSSSLSGLSPEHKLVETALSHPANEGDKEIHVEDVTDFARGMPLTISGENHSETKLIVSVTGGSGSQSVERRLA